MTYLDRDTAQNVKVSAAIFACTQAARHKLEVIAKLAACDVISSALIENQAAMSLRDYGPDCRYSDILLVHLSSNLEDDADIISTILGYLKHSSRIVFVWLNVEMLDAAYARLPSAQTRFLVGASDAEAVMLLKRETEWGTMDQLHDKGRDDSYEELHRLSDELAQFARKIADIVGNDTEDKLPHTAATQYVKSNSDLIGFPASKVNDAPVSFRPADPDMFRPLVQQGSPFIEDSHLRAHFTPASHKLAILIRNRIKSRRAREDFFESGLFADPAWDILLDLMAARLEGKQVSVSSLCIAAAVPPTTALRWITTMTESGLLERKQDPHDARRVFIELSNDAYEKLERCLKRILPAGEQE